MALWCIMDCRAGRAMLYAFSSPCSPSSQTNERHKNNRSLLSLFASPTRFGSSPRCKSSSALRSRSACRCPGRRWVDPHGEGKSAGCRKGWTSLVGDGCARKSSLIQREREGEEKERERERAQKIVWHKTPRTHVIVTWYSHIYIT